MNEVPHPGFNKPEEYETFTATNDLEEVADEYEKANTGIYPEVGQTSIRDAFIDGAKWQKEQMMKEAVPFYEILKAVPPGPERDKVKLIILKDSE